MKKALTTLLILVALIPAGHARAEHNVWGLLQVWYSYTGYDAEAIGAVPAGYETETQAGFGLRRGYLGLNFREDAFSGALLLNAGSSGVSLIDLWVDMRLGDVFSVRAGRFAGVGMRCCGLQSSKSLDLVERPIITGEWMGQLERGAGRTVGVQLSVRPNDVFRAAVLIHNNDLDLKRSVNDGSKDVGVTDTGAMPQVDVGFTATPSESMELGLTYGLSNEKQQTSANVSAHCYYETSRFFAKIDYAMLLHKDNLDEHLSAWGKGDLDYTGAGFSLTGGYELNEKLTLVGRFEQWDNDNDLDLDSAPGAFPDYWDDYDDQNDNGLEDDGESLSHAYSYRRNMSLGLNYSVKTDARYDQRFQITYTRRLDEIPDGQDLADPNVFQAVWQVYIH